MGKVVAAAAQERFSRIKGTYEFPIDAIEYCLEAADLTIKDIDYVAHKFNYEPYAAFFGRDPYLARQFDRVYSRNALLRLLSDAYRRWTGRFGPSRYRITSRTLLARSA